MHKICVWPLREKDNATKRDLSCCLQSSSLQCTWRTRKKKIFRHLNTKWHLNASKIKKKKTQIKNRGTRIINKARPSCLRIHTAFLKTFRLFGGKVWVLPGEMRWDKKQTLREPEPNWHLPLNIYAWCIFNTQHKKGMTRLFSLHYPSQLAHIQTHTHTHKFLHSRAVRKTWVMPRLRECWVNGQVCLTKIRTHAIQTLCCLATSRRSYSRHSSFAWIWTIANSN